MFFLPRVILLIESTPLVHMPEILRQAQIMPARKRERERERKRDFVHLSFIKGLAQVRET